MASETLGNNTEWAQKDRAVLDGLGARLRTLRERAERTLSEVAEATGISASTLSRLEQGSRRPVLDLLLPLAREYRVSLDELLTLPTAQDPRITPSITRDGQRIIQALSRRDSSVQVRRTRLLPRTQDEREERQLRSHAGFDWVYVLSGRLLLVLGEREFVLERGQAAEFDTTTPHWFGAADARPADFLSLFTQEGAKAHRH